MTRPPTHPEPGAGPGERSTATAKIKSHPVKGHPGVTLRTWIDRAGRTQRRYDATFWGPDRVEHSRTFRRLGDAEAWLEEERTSGRRGGGSIRVAATRRSAPSTSGGSSRLSRPAGRRSER
jgi:hypothetical protein